MTGAGTDGTCTDGDVLDLAILRDCDGEADRIADAASYSFDEVCEGLGSRERHEATHAGRFKVGDVGDRVDDRAGVVCGRSRISVNGGFPTRAEISIHDSRCQVRLFELLRCWIVRS